MEAVRTEFGTERTVLRVKRGDQRWTYPTGRRAGPDARAERVAEPHLFGNLARVPTRLGGILNADDTNRAWRRFATDVEGLRWGETRRLDAIERVNCGSRIWRGWTLGEPGGITFGAFGHPGMGRRGRLLGDLPALVRRTGRRALG